MAGRLGLKAHRKAFDATGKIAVSYHLAGEDARALIEFMEAEGIDTPGAAGKVLMTYAISAYPEWSAGVAMRRDAVTEQRMWMKERMSQMLLDIAAEAELNFAEGRAKMEEELIEAASQHVMENGE